MTNARTKWTAFYRLYRLAKKRNSEDGAFVDALYDVFPGRWVRLVREYVQHRHAWPKFLRKRFVAMDRKKRLHGKNYEFYERNQQVAATLRSEGREITPEEVGEVRVKVIRIVRDKAVKDGIDLPLNDADLMRWLAKK